ncbi:MAG: hypothetical protein WC465_03705 [Patescibacteria group bacterium]
MEVAGMSASSGGHSLLVRMGLVFLAVLVLSSLAWTSYEARLGHAPHNNATLLFNWSWLANLPRPDSDPLALGILLLGIYALLKLVSFNPIASVGQMAIGLTVYCLAGSWLGPAWGLLASLIVGLVISFLFTLRHIRRIQQGHRRERLLFSDVVFELFLSPLTGGNGIMPGIVLGIGAINGFAVALPMAFVLLVLPLILLCGVLAIAENDDL